MNSARSTSLVSRGIIAGGALCLVLLVSGCVASGARLSPPVTTEPPVPVGEPTVRTTEPAMKPPNRPVRTGEATVSTGSGDVLPTTADAPPPATNEYPELLGPPDHADSDDPPTCSSDASSRSRT
jgi:hypothetical protein